MAYKEQNLARKLLAGEVRLLTSPNVSGISEKLIWVSCSLSVPCLSFLHPHFPRPVSLWSGDEWILETATDVIWHELKVCCFVNDIWAL